MSSQAAPVAHSSFYSAMRILPERQREAMFAVYGFCRAVDDIADDRGPATAAERLAKLEQWRADIAAMFAGQAPSHLAALDEATRSFHLTHEDFDAVIDGMAMDAEQDIRAPDWATLDLYCDRVASAVGRLSVRIFGLPDEPGVALAYHLGRALQLTNILRDIDEDASIGRLYLPREALAAAGVATDEPLAAAADPKLASACVEVAGRAQRAFREGPIDHGGVAASGGESAAIDGRRIWLDPRQDAERGLRAATPARQGQPAAPAWRASAIRHPVNGGVVHIIGAGIAGLSAAVRLVDAGRQVIVHEAAAFAGGRCRSYLDPTLGFVIDNGNHLLLSGNHEALDYLDRIGARGTLHDPGAAIFDFADLKSGERWRLDLSEGRIPWWLFDRKKRVPGTALGEYLAPLGVFVKGSSATVGEAMRCEGPLYERLWRPLLTSALNTDPPESSAALTAALLRETFAAGGKACHPLFAAHGLASSFIDPALAFLAARGSPVRFGDRLKAVRFEGKRAVALDFDRTQQELGADDSVILGVPPWIAKDLLPGMTTPDEFRAILNVHFQIAPPRGPAGDPRRRQRRDRMVVRFSRPALRHDQQRRPAHRPSAR